MLTDLLVLVFPPACGAAFGWWLYRVDQLHQIQLNPHCDRLLEEARAMADSNLEREGPWIDLLQGGSTRCMGYPDYVRVLRFYLALAGRWNEARDLIDMARRCNTLPEDAAALEQGFTDVAEANEETRLGNLDHATLLYARASQAASAAITRWPEWGGGHQLLGEINGSGYKSYRKASGHFWSGAWLRSLDASAAAVLAGVHLALALWVLCLAAYSWVFAVILFLLLATMLVWAVWQRYLIQTSPRNKGGVLRTAFTVDKAGGKK